MNHQNKTSINNMETLAVFDFDGTLTKRDSFAEFIKFSKGKMFFILHAPVFLIFWLAFKVGFFTREKAKEHIFSHCFKNMPFEKFSAFCIAFSSKVDLILRKEAKLTLGKYLKPKSKIVIISASIEDWILPWAEKNQVFKVIATKVLVDEKQNLTGKFASKNCYGNEKVNRFLQEYPDYKKYRLIVYGNSQGDKEILDLADIGYMSSIK